MRSHAFILFAAESAWKLCRCGPGTSAWVDVPLEPGSTAAERAERVSLALRPMGYEGQGTLLAVPSSWCFAASIATEDLPKNDRKALLYRLEEKLPLAAEGLVADFIRPEAAGAEALGVAAVAGRLRELVDALESVGVAVQSISPAALLTAREIARAADREPAVLLCGEEIEGEPHVSLLLLAGGLPAAWALLPAEAGAIKLQLELATLDCEAAPDVLACGLGAELAASVAAQTGLRIGTQEGSPVSLAERAGLDILAGRERPWVELRRGPLAIADPLRLHRKPLDALLSAAAVLLLVVAGVLVFRGARYGRMAESSDRQMADAFRQQFAGWAVPGNVRAVVESEHRKGAARTGGSLPPEAARSALVTLRDVLAGLPADGHFTIDRATFEDDGFQMEGRLRSYEDVDAIAAAARHAGLTVDQPQARKDAQGAWSFVIRGVRPGPARTATARRDAE